MPFLMITRFNNHTWNELQNYRRSNNITGCIYGVPRRVAPPIPLKDKLYVLEMNNETNIIMGVGLVRNFIKMDRHHSIYSDQNFNRFSYYGKRRIDRSEFTRQQEELIQKMEERVFKGKGHLKRGQGIQKVPYERYNKTELQEIIQMFTENKSN